MTGRENKFVYRIPKIGFSHENARCESNNIIKAVVIEKSEYNMTVGDDFVSQESDQSHFGSRIDWAERQRGREKRGSQVGRRGHVKAVENTVWKSKRGKEGGELGRREGTDKIT